MTFIYEPDSGPEVLFKTCVAMKLVDDDDDDDAYSLEIHCMCKYELPTSKTFESYCLTNRKHTYR